MLVLTRKAGETIVIEGGIVIQILESAGTRTRLGISAPSDVAVHRGELVEQSLAFASRSVRSALKPERGTASV